MLEPLVNLIVLLSALSVASERLANWLKLGDPRLREPQDSARDEKARERRIALRALAASLVLAVVVRADFFRIVAHLEAPWDTLGWAQREGEPWSAGAFLQTLVGTAVTGLSLGFGSKFWHDMLDVVSGLRGAVRSAK